jgi:hypothetical protein
MISPEDYIEHRLTDQINWYDRKSAASHWLLLRGTYFLNKSDKTFSRSKSRTIRISAVRKWAVP